MGGFPVEVPSFPTISPDLYESVHDYHNAIIHFPGIRHLHSPRYRPDSHFQRLGRTNKRLNISTFAPLRCMPPNFFVSSRRDD